MMNFPFPLWETGALTQFDVVGDFAGEADAAEQRGCVSVGSNATGRLPLGGTRRVRLGPKTDLIPLPNPVAHASRLCNRAEEYGYAGSSECCPRAQASAVEQGKADRSKTAAAA